MNRYFLPHVAHAALGGRLLSLPDRRGFIHALPVMLRQGKPAQHGQLWQWVITEQGKATLSETLKRAPKQQQALAMLLQRPLYRHQVVECDLTDAALQSIKAKGLAELRAESPELQDWRKTMR